MGLTSEQQKIIENNKKNLIVSASAGSGKTFVLIKYISNLIIKKKVPLKRFLVLTFTKAAAREMKERLLKTFLEEKTSTFLNEQIDEMPSCDISTIDAFCEKVLKQNISKTDLDENFSILDEKQSGILKRKAFERTIEDFTENNSEGFAEIFFAFKKNKDLIFECVNDLANFFDSQEDEEYLIDYYLNNSEKFFKEACTNLNEKLKNEFLKTSLLLNNFSSDNAVLLEDYKKLNDFVYLNLSDDFIANAFLISQLDKPKLSQKKIDFENQQILKNAVAKVKEIIDFCKQFDLSSYSIQKQKTAVLPNAILKLYRLYRENYIKAKTNFDCIDFADCEKYTKVLLGNHEILKDLQANYDYIFIDEYQDTNKLQESIIKPIAEKGMFMAVGDIKQGIYGFRNANMEIMLNDIEQFSKNENSNALFLKSNFRSDKNILNFVNKIFKKAMTEDSAGVDYKNTSMLNGKQEFLNSKFPAVEVCVCKKEENEELLLPEIYSVKDDKLEIKSANMLEAKIICKKVKEFLAGEIFNPKTKKFEKVKPQDIAILFRGRNQIMNSCFSLLSKEGIPVTTDEKLKLFESPVVKILNNLLKLTISKNNDIALASVLCSPFGNFNFEEISHIAMADGENFYEKCKFLEEKNLKLKEFFKNLCDFEMLVQVKGVVESLKIFSDKFNFYENLLKELKNIQEKQNIEDYYNLIYNLDAEFNIPKIIETFENADISSNSVAQSDDSVLLTTIHATKGLEYPIVILAGCGENLEKVQPKQYAINKNYGIGTNVYDNVSLTKSPSIVLKAIKEQTRKKNWIDELMIFYVALTRAKNHLILCGTDKNLILKQEATDCKCYLDFVYFALGQDFENQNNIVSDFCSVNLIEDIEDEFVEKEEIITNINNYDKSIFPKLEYNYINKDFCNLQLKNSVTSINESEKTTINSFSLDKNDDFITIGNCYHHAMKSLNFEKIKDIESLEEEINKNLLLKEEINNYVNNDLILKNILIVKQLCGNRKIYKEKEFVMGASLKELGLSSGEQKIIVQGAIDCFALGEEDIILIDYKYSNIQNDKTLKNKYIKQLQTYALALSKNFKNKKIKTFLLSLKSAKIIEI